MKNKLNMKKFVFATVGALLLSACITSANRSDSTSIQAAEATYGFIEKKPIKVGGIDSSGPISEREYLNSLPGPKGEAVTFHRIGSCCFFTSKTSPMGGGLLDQYAVSYEGKKDTVVMYLNMYEKGKLRAPVGFIMK